MENQGIFRDKNVSMEIMGNQGILRKKCFHGNYGIFRDKDVPMEIMKYQGIFKDTDDSMMIIISNLSFFFK